MSEQELECQNHANCGDYCNTPREREMVLCEGCLDSYDMQQSDQEELCTLRTQVAELRAENERKQRTIDGMNAEHWKLVQAHASRAKDLEAARGLLDEANTLDRSGETEPTKLVHRYNKLMRKIRTFLTATPAPEVQAEQGERQEAVPEETPHIIVFDDADRPNEVFSGAGARPAALRRWEQISVSWNAHLFVRVEKNSRDDPNPCARLATTQQPSHGTDGPAAQPVKPCPNYPSCGCKAQRGESCIPF